MQPKIFSLLLLCILACCLCGRARAQADELAQLALNIEKLNQFRQILTQMKNTYQIITRGYNTVRDLTQGNFSLHRTFLDALLEVSPSVRKYHKIAAIIERQQQIVTGYRNLVRHCKDLRMFSAGELEYISGVCTSLGQGTIGNLEELLMIITASRLRMNDAERMAAIDRLHERITSQWEFLHYFSEKTTRLAAGKTQSATDYQRIDQYYDFKLK